MSTAAINGVHIHFQDTGGSGPVLLFSHGFMMDHTMFATQVAALSDQYRCVSWDERGFGMTAASDNFTYWDSANDAVALLDHLGISEAVFIGMSQGGYLSLRAAIAHPSRVRALVLIDSGAKLDDPQVIAGYQGMLEALCGEDESVYDAVAAGVGQIILGDQALIDTWLPIWKARRDSDRDALRVPGATLMGRDDISDRLGEISCPTLVIHGTADVAIPIESAEHVVEQVQRGQLVVVEGGTHASNMTHPTLVNQAISSFLATIG
jgi:3-oxoadipate enol-lactonase